MAYKKFKAKFNICYFYTIDGFSMNIGHFQSIAKMLFYFNSSAEYMNESAIYYYTLDLKKQIKLTRKVTIDTNKMRYR